MDPRGDSDCGCTSDCDENCDCIRHQIQMRKYYNVNVVHTRVYNAVKSSLCPRQFEEFIDFRMYISDFCGEIGGGEEGGKNDLFIFFRNPPNRVRRLDWIKFGDWIKSYKEGKFTTICGSWSEYAKNCIKNCEGCRNASMCLIDFDKVIFLDGHPMIYEKKEAVNGFSTINGCEDCKNASQYVPPNSTSERVRDIVRRSMCEWHYNDFSYFHATIDKFGSEMNQEWPGVHAHLFAIFPSPPYKTGKFHWDNFRSWLEHGLGEKVKDLCLPWVDYGFCTINGCDDCKEASIYVPDPHADELIEISSDKQPEMDEEVKFEQLEDTSEDPNMVMTPEESDEESFGESDLEAQIEFLQQIRRSEEERTCNGNSGQDQGDEGTGGSK